MALFESYERRIKQIDAVLNSYGIASIEEAEKITKDAGLDVYKMVAVSYTHLDGCGGPACGQSLSAGRVCNCQNR